MEYYGKILCISYEDLTYDDRPVVVDGGLDYSRSRCLDGRRPETLSAEVLAPIMSVANYKQLCRRKQINVVRPGKGLGHNALVEVATLPARFKERIEEKYGNMEADILKDWFGQHYRIDAEARSYYAQYRFGDGASLPVEKVNEYTVNASTLEAVVQVMADTNIMRKAMHGQTVNWGAMAGAISWYKTEFGHTLPLSPHRFRERVSSFQKEGYASLISKKFKNGNSRKTTVEVVRLVLSLDCQPDGTRPFNTVVGEAYNQFVRGEMEVVDPVTGELYDPKAFVDKKGNPLVLSAATISNILNSPEHKALRAKYHDTGWAFSQTYRPHHLRHNPLFALSKISADDRDLPFALKGSQRVHGYFIYDVLSDCVIGKAYGRRKDDALFVECVRDMFRLLIREGWNMPAEIEVERHIVNHFAEGFMKAQVLFPLVRWCNPGNSQEKSAEHKNRKFKYGVEKQNHANTGRFYARLEANRPKVEKEYDETNNKWKVKEYTWDEIVAANERDIYEYNHELHPDQKRFKGMTRWDVLEMMQNPGLRPIEKWYVYRYIGERTETTLRRNMYCTVMHDQYVLPSPQEIRKLKPGSTKVEAYWLAAEDGSVGEVYLWQGDEYLCCCQRAARYNTATVEQTEADRAAYTEQAKYVSQFDKMMKDGKISPVVTMKKADTEAIWHTEARAVRVESQEAEDASDGDYSDYMDTSRYRREAVGRI